MRAAVARHPLGREDRLVVVQLPSTPVSSVRRTSAVILARTTRPETLASCFTVCDSCFVSTGLFRAEWSRAEGCFCCDDSGVDAARAFFFRGDTTGIDEHSPSVNAVSSSLSAPTERTQWAAPHTRSRTA